MAIEAGWFEKTSSRDRRACWASAGPETTTIWTSPSWGWKAHHITGPARLHHVAYEGEALRAWSVGLALILDWVGDLGLWTIWLSALGQGCSVGSEVDDPCSLSAHPWLSTYYIPYAHTDTQIHSLSVYSVMCKTSKLKTWCWWLYNVARHMWLPIVRLARST